MHDLPLMEAKVSLSLRRLIGFLDIPLEMRHQIFQYCLMRNILIAYLSTNTAFLNRVVVTERRAFYLYQKRSDLRPWRFFMVTTPSPNRGWRSKVKREVCITGGRTQLYAPANDSASYDLTSTFATLGLRSHCLSGNRHSNCLSNCPSRENSALC
jgi:hypothetical protein